MALSVRGVIPSVPLNSLESCQLGRNGQGQSHSDGYSKYFSRATTEMLTKLIPVLLCLAGVPC